MSYPDTILYYITDGDVRGRCPHKHRTESGAHTCLRRDHAGCSSQGGYSDRRVYAIHKSGNTTGPYHEVEA